MKRRNVKTSKRQNGERRKRPWLRCVGVWAVVFLFIGAATNLFVAWRMAASYGVIGIDYFGTGREYVTKGKDAQTSPFWRLDLRDSFTGVESVFLTACDDRTLGFQPIDTTKLPAWSIGHSPPTQIVGKKGIAVRELATGWPLLTILSRELDQRGRFEATVYPELGIDQDMIPVRPMWLGLVINTVIYAGAAWIVFLFLMSMMRFVCRRAIREQRGMCPECAYDLRGADHGKCPECGEAIT